MKIFARLFLLCLCCSGNAFAKRPDMVVFLTDDHTRRDSSVYGSTEFPTPNMKRLADRGMVFDDAYVVSPSCAPSRAAMLTGMLPQHNGAEPNHSAPRKEIKKLPAYLQELGYQVVSFGKVGHYNQTKNYGFDIARHYNYHEDVAIPKAVEWLKQRKSTKPLCLFVGTNWPHVPWPKKVGRIDQSKLKTPPNHIDTEVNREWRARYAAAVKRMDDDLGRVLDAVEEVLGEDTFILETADHGAQWPFAKWNLYDDGLSTPMIVSWPGKIQPGTRTSATVTWMDILPTLVDVAGGEKPQGIDGRSFLPALLGKDFDSPDLVFGTHSGDGNFNVYPTRSVRTRDGWKYIRNLHPEFLFTSHSTKEEKGSYWMSWVEEAERNPEAAKRVFSYQHRPAEELYHVKADPYEMVNLAEDPEHADRLKDLREKLDAWLKETGDKQKVYGEPKLIADQKPDAD